MSIFSSILSKIFPRDHPAVAQVQAESSVPSVGQAASSSRASTPTAATAPTPPAVSAPLPQVDIEQILTSLAAKNPEKLNWQSSIVDLMKLLGLDSSLTARKQLAAELHYSGDMNDSAGMNLWLQKEVIQKLAANGGKVPSNFAT